MNPGTPDARARGAAGQRKEGQRQEAPEKPGSTPLLQRLKPQVLSLFVEGSHRVNSSQESPG